MHHRGIVVAGEDIAGAAHVSGKLIQLIEPAIDYSLADILTPQIADDEIVGLGVAELGKLKIDPANPETLGLQVADQMIADEPAGPADQGPLLSRKGRKLNLLKTGRVDILRILSGRLPKNTIS